MMRIQRCLPAVAVTAVAMAQVVFEEESSTEENCQCADCITFVGTGSALRIYNQLGGCIFERQVPMNLSQYMLLSSDDQSISLSFLSLSRPFSSTLMRYIVVFHRLYEIHLMITLPIVDSSYQLTSFTHSVPP